MNDQEHNVPRWADRFLAWFCAPELLEEVQGDLYESFARNTHEMGINRARRRYVRDMLRFFNYSTIRGTQPRQPKTIYLPMLKNYFKITLRLFAKNKAYLLINTLGLGIALACCMVAYLFFAYNYEFDQFHNREKVARTFKIHTQLETKSGHFIETIEAPVPLAPDAASEIAGIERYTRFITGSGFVSDQEKGFREIIGFADSTFFDMFDFPLLAGDHRYFRDKNAVYLTVDLAEKFFGDTADPIGQDLTLNFPNDKAIPVTVGGILGKFPFNNSFNYDAMVRFEHYIDVHGLERGDWSDWRNPSTFLELTSVESAPVISDQLSRYVALRNESRQDATVKDYRLEQFHARFSDEEISTGYVNTREPAAILIIFGSIAAMILLIACFNLTNTSIAMEYEKAERDRHPESRRRRAETNHRAVSLRDAGDYGYFPGDGFFACRLRHRTGVHYHV